MKDDFDPLGCSAERRLVEDIPFDELHLVGEIGQIAAIARGEIVDDANYIAAAMQDASERGADESRSARDEYMTWHCPVVSLTVPKTEQIPAAVLPHGPRGPTAGRPAGQLPGLDILGS